MWFHPVRNQPAPPEYLRRFFCDLTPAGFQQEFFCYVCFLNCEKFVQRHIELFLLICSVFECIRRSSDVLLLFHVSPSFALNLWFTFRLCLILSWNRSCMWTLFWPLFCFTGFYFHCSRIFRYCSAMQLRLSSSIISRNAFWFPYSAFPIRLIAWIPTTSFSSGYSQ